MLKKIILLCTVVFGIGVSDSFAQQDAQYTQYMYNTQVFNPGYVGTTRNASVSALHRQQWIGIEGAPQTTTLTLNVPLRKGLGIGGSLIHDVIGVTSESNLSFDIAYRLKIDRKYTLSFGMKGGVNLLSTNFNDLKIFHPNEDLSEVSASRIAPTVGAGAFFYAKRFYAGLSAPNLVVDQILPSQVGVSIRERAHLNFIAGYVHKVNRNIKIKPAGLVKYVKGAPLNWHLSVNALFKDRFVAGLAYQWKSSASLLLGLYIKERTFIGYTYDLGTSALRTFNSGSHEIFLRVKLGQIHRSNVVSPRFF